jgi:DNA-binding MarR family transcriptional regulator
MAARRDQGTGTLVPDGEATPATMAPSQGAGPPGSGPTLLYVIKQVELAARARLEDIFRPIGMTALQYTALTVLERHSGISSAQLARNSFVTAQTMTDMIVALEDRGLIERHRDPADGRRLLVVLTGSGRALLDRYRDEVNRLEARMLTGLPQDQVAELRATLGVCRANLADRPGRI